MTRQFNFSAGPAMLPTPVLEQARSELLDWHGSGASIMEVSHRGKDFIGVAERAEAALRRLMGISDDYAVLFLQGGATQHFAQLAMNLAGPQDHADYVVTGAWGEKAVREAAGYCKVRVAASSKDTAYTSIPDPSTWDLQEDAAYLHYTPNETIHGVEFHLVPASPHAPLIADMSSTILSRPVDVSRFGMIYAGAQKNIGPSGLVVVIIERSLLDRAAARRPELAAVLSYAAQAASESMLNTPPTFAWYLAGLVFDWLEAQGGLAAMGERNAAKAVALYQAIDGSGQFYRNPVDPECRSWMNVPFRLHDDALDRPFLAESQAAGLMALKGHRALGGMRASIYNAMPEEGVAALVSFMADFQRRNG